MSKPQSIDLVVWIGPGREFCPVLEHTRIKTENGDMTLRGNLSLCIMPADVPKEPGLHLVRAMGHVYLKPGYGYECRLILEYSFKIARNLAELLAEAQARGLVDA